MAQIVIKSIDKRGGTGTEIFVDGVEIGKAASEFSLTQNAGEYPCLTVKYIAHDGIDAVFPETEIREITPSL